MPDLSSHQPSMTFAQMMEQTSGVDSDNSFEAELGNAKSELKALIDQISEVCLVSPICLLNRIDGYSVSPIPFASFTDGRRCSNAA